MRPFDPAQCKHLIHDAFSLSGQTAIVAGAGSVGQGFGIGRATAILLAEAGAKVGLLDQDRDAAELTQQLISERGGQSVTAIGDLADSAVVQECVRSVVDQLGPATILVNNIGIVGPSGTVDSLELDDWDPAMRVNVTSMVMTSRAVVPLMVEAGGGSIINISSVAGVLGGYPSAFYPTSKGATISLTKAMAAHHGKDGIRVNAVVPGMLFTPRIENRGVTPQMRKDRAEASILKTEGTGWDAAYAVLYLASPAAQWVTGISLPVDAGLTATQSIQSPPQR